MHGSQPTTKLMINLKFMLLFWLVATRKPVWGSASASARFVKKVGQHRSINCCCLVSAVSITSITISSSSSSSPLIQRHRGNHHHPLGRIFSSTTEQCLCKNLQQKSQVLLLLLLLLQLKADILFLSYDAYYLCHWTWNIFQSPFRILRLKHTNQKN